MDELQVFDSISFGQVRVQELDNEVWFVAKDVCECLGINDTSKAVGRLDEDEKGANSIPTPGGNQNLLTVNEYGLYNLVLSSRKPEAKEFKRWITHDVIPAIRKTGSYSMVIPQTLPEALRAYADEVESHNATKAIVAQQEQQIAEFKPVKDYVDKILSSKSCLTITQIAADYGLSAQELNKILHEAGLQRKVVINGFCTSNIWLKVSPNQKPSHSAEVMVA